VGAKFHKNAVFAVFYLHISMNAAIDHTFTPHTFTCHMPLCSSHAKKCKEHWPICRLPSDMAFLTENSSPVILVGSVAFFTLLQQKMKPISSVCSLYLQEVSCHCAAKLAEDDKRSTWGGLEKRQMGHLQSLIQLFGVFILH